MAVYRYHFYDQRGQVFIDTLPMESVQFTAEMRGVGTFTGDIPLYADGLTAQRVLLSTIPHRTKVFVERDNALVWGGRVIPPRDYDAEKARLTINAEETLGAFAARYMPTVSFLGQDQLDIARGIIDRLQNDFGGHVGISSGGELSGVLRDRNYLATDQTIGLEALTNLSEVINGFDFTVQVTWNELMRPNERLVIGYPRLGRYREQAGLVLEYNRFSSAGGNVDSYTWSDGVGLFTRSWATTETEEGVQLVASKTNTELINAGYPLLEQTESHDGITILATLQGHADAMSARSAGHRVTAVFTVRGQEGFELGDWQMGDDVLVRISDWRFPPDPRTGAPGFTGYLRIVGWQVTPGVDGVEVYELTVADFLEVL